jgi:3-dehydroquinate synthase
MRLIKIQVKTKTQKYPIVIGSGAISHLPRLLKENSIHFSKCLIVIDKKVPKNMINKFLKNVSKKKIFTYYFNANETNKNQSNVNAILNILLQENFNRNDCLMSIGGGITGDVSAFVSSIFKRGLKFINIPTTLLAQVDSSIGGKTGINTKQGKNLIGTFYQPSLVVSDTNFLKTLPKREIICGYGEILKHALISDKNFFKFLDSKYSKILNLESPFIEKTIYKSCNIKKNIVEKDEKEKNLRKVLNFGHTFAHAYEATLSYSKRLNHGEAVILGMNTASKFSLFNNFLDKDEFNLIQSHLEKVNLPINISKFFSKKDLKNIIFFMLKDKKNISEKINLILLKKIGRPIFKKTFNKKMIINFLKKELAYKYL